MIKWIVFQITILSFENLRFEQALPKKANSVQNGQFFTNLLVKLKNKEEQKIPDKKFLTIDMSKIKEKN